MGNVPQHQLNGLDSQFGPLGRSINWACVVGNQHSSTAGRKCQGFEGILLQCAQTRWCHRWNTGPLHGTPSLHTGVHHSLENRRCCWYAEWQAIVLEKTFVSIDHCALLWFLIQGDCRYALDMSNLEKCVPPDNAANSSSTLREIGVCWLLSYSPSKFGLYHPSGDGYNWGCHLECFTGSMMPRYCGKNSILSQPFLSMQKGLCRVWKTWVINVQGHRRAVKLSMLPWKRSTCLSRTSCNFSVVRTLFTFGATKFTSKVCNKSLPKRFGPALGTTCTLNTAR